MLAKTGFQILVLPDCPYCESYAIGFGTCEQQYAVANHAVAQERRSIVEENKIEPIARNPATERTGQTPDRILDRRRIRRVLVVEQHRDVDVALAAGGPACPASMQPGETHRGVPAQSARELVVEPGNLTIAGVRGHGVFPLVTLPVPRRISARTSHAVNTAIDALRSLRYIKDANAPGPRH